MLLIISTFKPLPKAHSALKRLPTVRNVNMSAIQTRICDGVLLFPEVIVYDR